jgi:hypothetical protein
MLNKILKQLISILKQNIKTNIIENKIKINAVFYYDFFKQIVKFHQNCNKNLSNSE